MPRACTSTSPPNARLATLKRTCSTAWSSLQLQLVSGVDTVYLDSNRSVLESPWPACALPGSARSWTHQALPDVTQAPPAAPVAPGLVDRRSHTQKIFVVQRASPGPVLSHLAVVMANGMSHQRCSMPTTSNRQGVSPSNRLSAGLHFLPRNVCATSPCRASCAVSMAMDSA
jgi:hypothetical protein